MVRIALSNAGIATDDVRLAIEGGRLGELLEQWDREAAEFTESRKPFLLY